MTLSPSTRLGPYEILAPLGAGGMGEVYRARDTRLKREVAVKVLPASVAGDPERIRRFEQEARAASALNHPNIVTVFDVGTHEGKPFLVTELLEGRTLREALAEKRPGLPAIAGWARKIAAGLSAAHARGIVHRDLKPENIFVTSGGELKLLDFGLAKLTAPDGTALSQAATLPGMTSPGMVVGTVGYMSPEQLRGLPLDPRSDLFALGTILHELLSGSSPFRRETAADTMSAILHDNPPALPVRGPFAVPAALSGVVQRCLEKDPAARFQSATDVLAALEDVPVGSTGPARKPPTTGSLDVGLRIALLAGATVITAVGMYFAIPTVWNAPPENDSSERQSIAVLPFVNRSPEKDNEYFSDGITEDLITALSKISGLRVAATTSSFALKGSHEDVRAIAAKLHVNAVLEGSVSREGNRVRITAQLINAVDGFTLWSESYDRELNDIFAIRAQVAQTVAAALKVSLLAGERTTLARQPTQDLEAYQLYLKGRQAISSFSGAGLERGLGFMQQAIARDPNYALAHLGVSYYYIASCDYIPGNEALPRARAAARKALELDPSLAEAHTYLGWVTWLLERDHATAEKEFAAAIAAQPDLSVPHELYSWYLVCTGRPGEGIAESRKAVELDPLSPEANAVHGLNYYFARRNYEAIRQLELTVKTNPEYVWGHEFLGRAYARAHRWPEAMAELQEARRCDSTSTEVLSALGRMEADRGNRAGALRVLEQFRQISKSGFVSAYFVATVSAGLGQADSAFAQLARANEQRSYWLGWIAVDPEMDTLRADPRFASLLRPMGR